MSVLGQVETLFATVNLVRFAPHSRLHRSEGPLLGARPARVAGPLQQIRERHRAQVAVDGHSIGPFFCWES